MVSFSIITIKNVKNYVSTNHIVVKNMMNEQINPSNVIAAVISQWETAFIEPVIFGTSNQLWPTPHSQLFDFEATNVGTDS